MQVCFYFRQVVIFRLIDFSRLCVELCTVVVPLSLSIHCVPAPVSGCRPFIPSASHCHWWLHLLTSSSFAYSHPTSIPNSFHFQPAPLFQSTPNFGSSSQSAAMFPQSADAEYLQQVQMQVNKFSLRLFSEEKLLEISRFIL